MEHREEVGGDIQVDKQKGVGVWKILIAGKKYPKNRNK
jgi:hypothetical protein